MTDGTNDMPPPCPTPLESTALTDYWLALLDAEEEALVEEHLLSCDICSERLRETIQVCEALRDLAQSGNLRVVVADEFVRHAAGGGRQVRQYDVAPGQAIACTISADDDFLIGRMAADLRSAGRVDLSLCDPRGVEWQRMADIPVRPDVTQVVLQEPAGLAKGAPSGAMIARLLAVDADGAERLIGEYTFQHTRTIPGPPAWEFDF